jgi:hypothetical protein
MNMATTAVADLEAIKARQQARAEELELKCFSLVTAIDAMLRELEDGLVGAICGEQERRADVAAVERRNLGQLSRASRPFLHDSLKHRPRDVAAVVHPFNDSFSGARPRFAISNPFEQWWA